MFAPILSDWKAADKSGRSKKNKRNNGHNLSNSNINNDIQNCFFLRDNISSYTSSTAYLNKQYGNELCKCKSKICKLKPNFVSKNEIASPSSQRIFACVVPND